MNIVFGLLANSIKKGTLPSRVARLVKHKPRAVTFTPSKKIATPKLSYYTGKQNSSDVSVIEANQLHMPV